MNTTRFLSVVLLLFFGLLTQAQTYVTSREILRDSIDPLGLRPSQSMIINTNGLSLVYKPVVGSVVVDSAVEFNSVKRAGYKWVCDWNGDIMAFGIKADGTTDDTTATQAAIDYAVAHGLTLYLPNGYHTSIVANLIVSDDSNIQGPDDMFSMSSSIVANEQNRWIWKLKDGANTNVISYTAGQHTLRGVTIDGNKDNNTADVPALNINVGFTSYKESHWENIGVFNSAGDGIYNKAHSPVFDRIMSQNNNGNGLVIFNGYDSAITHSYFGGNGKHGILALDHGSFRWVQVDSFQNRMSGVRLLNPYLGYFDKIVCNNNLQNGWLMSTMPSTNYTLVSTGAVYSGLLGEFTILNSQFINNNHYLDKQGLPSPEADGTWSNFKVEGGGSIRPYNVFNTQFNLSENTAAWTKKPKYLIESTATLVANLFGANFLNCRLTSDMNYFRVTNMSGTIQSTASFLGLRDSKTSLDYANLPLGGFSIGSASFTGTPLTLSETGSSMMEWNRTGLPQKWKLALGFRSWILTEETANFKGFAFENNGTPTLYFGTLSSGGASPVSGIIKAESATSGTNTTGSNLSLYAGSGTGGSYIGGSINFYTPDVILNGAGSPLTNAVVQTNILRMQLLNDGSVYIPPLLRAPVSSVGGKFYYGENSVDPGTNRWWFAEAGTWTPLSFSNSISGGGGTGSVMSVGLALPSIFGVSGSPVTSSGTLTGTLTTQPANRIFAGPTTGADATPTFRAIVDDDVPNTITIDLASVATVANSGDSATSFFSSGTIEDARIDSVIARDSEVAAGYQPLDADLTAMAAGTAVATAQTNAVSMGAPTQYVGSTNVAEAIALKSPLASPAFTGSPTVPDDPYDATSWNDSTGIPTKNAIRDKIESMSSGSGDVSSTGNNTLSGTNTFSGPTWIKPNRKRVVLFEKEWNGLTSGNMGYPEFNGTALASGSATIISGETNHPGMVRLTSSSSANSGYYYVSSTSGLYAEPLLTWESISRVRGTNAGISSTHGFTDSVNSSNPTDAIRMWRSNNFLIPQIWNNGSLVQGYEYPVSSNQVLYIKVQVQTNMTDVSFYSEDSDTKTLIVSTNLTGTIPASSSRVFGMGHFAFFTNAVAIGIEDLDWSTAYIDTPVNR